ncbi:hypothetical protein BH11PSE7_BH11PSE7_05950 [soil metagenome]
MRIDWILKLRHLLQVWAFGLAIGTIQYAFMPERPYGPPVAYSLLIGTITWAIIDLGRELFPSSAETGWPRGWHGLALVAAGIAVGYILGTAIADQLCQYYGWFPPGSGAPRSGDLRTSILITALAGTVVTYFFYTGNKSAYLERKMTEARGHASEARLKLLETQLEPHMLFNTLANLRVLIATDPQAAQDMLDRMIAYLRATLSASRATTHTLEAEFERLRDYLELMKVRMGPRLSYALDLPPELARHPVPTLLLQPLVENSIQHGLEPKVGGGHIAVTARRDGNQLVLDVTDTGIGAALAPGAGKGFGLTQVRERLATLYGAAASLDFAATQGDGAHVVSRLPFTP